MKRHRKTESGNAIVEFALVVVVLVPLLAGVIDFSFLAQSRRNLTDAARAAGRAGVQACIGSGTCTAGNPADADTTLYLAIRNVLGSKAPNVTKLIIYKSTTANQNVPATCLTSTTGGVSGLCNVLVNPYATSSTPTIPTNWSIATRNRDNATADYLGVYLEYTHQNFFRVFANTRQLRAQAAFRLEPPVTQSANLQPLPTFPQAPLDHPGWTWTEPNWGGGGGGPYVPPNPGNGAG